METALLAMVAATIAMIGLLWVAMVGLYRQMGRLETILSFLGRHTHDKSTGVPSLVFPKTRISRPLCLYCWLSAAMKQRGSRSRPGAISASRFRQLR